ncbi:hypothetical protein HYZ70_01005 [Candidatus Curtissbacteria bacterium]|nr:hypothetical protein [Candidatus Curtissbacteria bacterium]
MSIFQPTLTPAKIPLKIIGWIPYWDQKAGLESFSKNVKFLDFVSVFWYRIDSNGELTTYKKTVENQSIIDSAHTNNVKVMAVVANLQDYDEGDDWDFQRVNLVISNPIVRKKHIAALIELAKNKNFDGIDIDYEALKKSQRENFSLFIEELAENLHQNGKLLGVAIHPKTSENNPQEDNGSHAQDLERIAKAADHLYFMTYTEHDSSSEPGSAGSIEWIKRVMSYTLNELNLPKQKVFLGIGLFGLEWHQTADSSYQNDNNDLNFKQVQSLITNNRAEVIWDSNTKSSYFYYDKNGERHVVWFENSQSVINRIELARQLGITNLALWRLGEEDPTIWGELH